MNSKEIPVWTLLQGQVLLKTFGVISKFGDDDTVCTVMDDPRFCTFRVPHEIMLGHYNILVFVGLIPQGGVSNKVIRLDQEVAPRAYAYSPFIKGGISTRKGSAALLVSNGAPFDTTVTAFSSSEERFVQGEQLVQVVYRSVLAFPKRDGSGTIITFRYPSLEPQYRFVRSLPNELIICSASSY
ncbi:MAG: hypothetical protein IPK84_03225 [Candidatus Moraniibacteriota bacterium]|nr:MAG: hypothetical protein IPK84_03225 [Candidatus Moranbacteria bacterium]